MSCISLPESSPVEVNIRVRPLSQKEIINNVKNIILVDKNKISLINPEDNNSKDFQYDYVYDRETTQQNIYDNVGKKIIDHAFNGYNCCIFAYGISGSGKTHTIMGYNNELGLIPRISQSLFDQQLQKNNLNNNMQYKIDISYFEIYSEKIRDLLSSHKSDTIPQIREHPEYGPYVEGLTSINISSAILIKKLIEQGNKERTIASTLLNDRSSRSHAILTIIFNQINTTDGTETTSKINIVDLAGSEKISLSGVKGVNLKEAININASLSTLGLVISRLAETSNKGKKTDGHIPFRDSILTWILKESLGGNSKTYMIANVSPASIHYNENLNTLRYARNAKKIINSVHINQDTSERIINMLKEEIKTLKSKIGNTSDFDEIKKLQNVLKEREELMKEKEKTWEERIIENQKINEALQLQLRQELEQKQSEFRKNLDNMLKENHDLINEINKLRDENKNYQENILLSDKFNEEILNTKKDFEKKQEQFEKERIVEATWQLQEKYDKKIDELRISYEIKIDELRTIHAIKIVQLNTEISFYTNEIGKLNKEAINFNKKINDLENNINELKDLINEKEKVFLSKEKEYIEKLELFNNLSGLDGLSCLDGLDKNENIKNDKRENNLFENINENINANIHENENANINANIHENENIKNRFTRSYSCDNYSNNLSNLNNLNNLNNETKISKLKEINIILKRILEKENKLLEKENKLLEKENTGKEKLQEILEKENELVSSEMLILSKKNENINKENELAKKEIEILEFKKILLEQENNLKENKKSMMTDFNILNNKYSDLINIHNEYKKDYENIKENQKLLNEENELLNDKIIQTVKDNEDLIQKNKQLTENIDLITLEFEKIKLENEKYITMFNNTDYKNLINNDELIKKINNLENELKHKTDQFNIDRNSLTKQIQQLHGRLNNL